MRRWPRLVVPLALLVAAATLALVGLGHPDREMFDEVYYANDAHEYLTNHGVEEEFAVHPPVGKWLIAGGIAALGDNPVGWRIAPALAGVAVVGLTYLLGRRLFRRVAPAALAGLLVLLDGLMFTQARIAMLDEFLVLFVVLGAYFVVRDLDASGLRDERRLPLPAGGAADEPPPRPATVVVDRGDDQPQLRAGEPVRDIPDRRHPWRYLAGVAFGLAVATKWSGAYALAAAGLVVLGAELAWRRRLTGRWTVRSGWSALSIVAALGVVPVAVYAATWAPWIANMEWSYEGGQRCGETQRLRETCDLSIGERVAGFVDNHRAVVRFHADLEATHNYRGPAWSWPVLARPVVYYWETCNEDRHRGEPVTESDGTVTTPEPCSVGLGESAEILALGNPVLWWGFLAAAPLVAAGAARRDRRAAFLGAFWLVQYLPWLAVTRPSFLFYMAPAVPFMALAVAYATHAVREGRRLRAPWTGAAVGGAVGAAAGFGAQAVAGLDTDLGVAWILLGAGALVGAAAGELLAGRRSPRGVPRPRPRAAAWVTGALVVGAVSLFVWFFPILVGMPLDDEVLRLRWWFPGWI